MISQQQAKHAMLHSREKQEQPPEWNSGIRHCIAVLEASLQAGHLQTDFSRQLEGVSSDTLVRLASGLSEKCIKKQCGLAGLCFAGCMTLDLHLS